MVGFHLEHIMKGLNAVADREHMRHNSYKALI